MSAARTLAEWVTECRQSSSASRLTSSDVLPTVQQRRARSPVRPAARPGRGRRPRPSGQRVRTARPLPGGRRAGPPARPARGACRQRRLPRHPRLRRGGPARRASVQPSAVQGVVHPARGGRVRRCVRDGLHDGEPGQLVPEPQRRPVPGDQQPRVEQRVERRGPADVTAASRSEVDPGADQRPPRRSTARAAWLSRPPARARRRAPTAVSRRRAGGEHLADEVRVAAGQRVHLGRASRPTAVGQPRDAASPSGGRSIRRVARSEASAPSARRAADASPRARRRGR